MKPQIPGPWPIGNRKSQHGTPSRMPLRNKLPAGMSTSTSKAKPNAAPVNLSPTASPTSKPAGSQGIHSACHTCVVGVPFRITSQNAATSNVVTCHSLMVVPITGRPHAPVAATIRTARVAYFRDGSGSKISAINARKNKAAAAGKAKIGPLIHVGNLARVM